MLHDQGKEGTLVAFLHRPVRSMETIKTETIGGFNAYLDTLEREAGDIVESPYCVRLSVDREARHWRLASGDRRSGHRSR